MNKTKKLLILGIDTSCDDTSVAILEEDRVLSNVISSQVSLHREFGGVVPMIAKREHESRIDLVIQQAIKNGSKILKRKISLKDIDVVAVTYGPGLSIALEVGIKKAKEIALKYNIKLVGVNHMEGHLLSSLTLNSKSKGQIHYRDLKYPVLGLLISGGHTQLILMSEIGKYQLMGETLDDAVGEAYDKTARMLGLGYPGGQVLTEMAMNGVASEYKFPVPMAKDPSLNFSFSGLKTSVYYLVRNLTRIVPKINESKNIIKGEKFETRPLTKKQIYNIAASFELSAITQLQIKLLKTIRIVNPRTILVGGGVSSSVKVRAGLRKIINVVNKKSGKNKISIYFPRSQKFTTDNGAMIGLAGFFKAKRGEYSNLSLDREPNASLEYVIPA